MNAIDIDKLKQLIARTDISGNDKVRWLTDFIDGRELQLIQDEFYSKEEVLKLLINFSDDRTFLKKDIAVKWFNKFKKK
jgi:hypothetical protein